MRRMSDREAIERIIELLKARGRMPSFEIDAYFKDRDEECPDTLVAFLARMRTQGLIKGEISSKQRGWVWWVD